MLTWSEKLTLLTTKGLTWKEVQEMDKGLEAEKNMPEPTPEPTPEPEPTPKPEPTPESEPTEREQVLMDKVKELEVKLKEAQDDNIHGNNGGTEPSFDEQLDSMFKDYRF